MGQIYKAKIKQIIFKRQFQCKVFDDEDFRAEEKEVRDDAFVHITLPA